MVRRQSHARSGRFEIVRYLPVPGLLLLAHLTGGADGPVEAGGITALLGAMFAWSVWTGRLRLDAPYVSGLRVPLVCLGLLLSLALVSVAPGSGVLASGWIADRAAIDTLSVDPEATWVEIVKLTGLGVVFVLAHRTARRAGRADRSLRVIAWLSTVWAVWALVLYAGADGGAPGPSRLSGTFVSPNVAGCLLAIGWFCWLGLAVPKLARDGPRGPAFGLADAASGLVLAAALLLTASRSAIGLTLVLSLAGAAPTLVDRFRTGRRWTPAQRVVGCASALLGIVILARSSGALFIRMGDLASEAANRRALLETYGAVMDQAPVLGHGLGTVPRISRLLLTPQNDAVLWNVRAVHNLVLQWWIETGVVGLALAAAGLACVIGSVLRPGRDRPARLAMPVACVSAFILLQGMVDYSAQIYSICLTWTFLLGLAYSLRTTPMSSRAASGRGEAPVVRFRRPRQPRQLNATGVNRLDRR